MLNRALKSPGRHDVFCVMACRVTLVENFKWGVSGNGDSVTFVITEAPITNGRLVARIRP